MKSLISPAPAPAAAQKDDELLYCAMNQCFRSLGATLTAAATSFGLFAAANWGMPDAMAENKLLKKVWYHIRFAFAAPCLPYFLSILNARIVGVVLTVVPPQRELIINTGIDGQQALNMQLQVATVNVFPAHEERPAKYIIAAAHHCRRFIQNLIRPFLDRKSKKPAAGSLNILALCPMYLQIPALQGEADQEQQLGQHVGRYDILPENVINDLSPLRFNASELQHNYTFISSPGPASMLDSVAAAHRPAHQASLHESTAIWAYLKVPDTSSFPIDRREEALEERCALLASVARLPGYSELCFLRTRSSFQSIITALQAMGFILHTLQRLALRGVSEVSPLEVIIAVICKFTLAQMVVELIRAPASYQRPLLLHLDSSQLLRFCNAPRDNMDRYSSLCSRKVSFCFHAAPWLIAVIITVSPAAVYFAHYLQHQNYLCAVTAVLFFFALNATFLLLLDSGESAIYIKLAVNALVVVTITAALVATIVQWNPQFHKPTQNNHISIDWSSFFPYFSG